MQSEPVPPSPYAHRVEEGALPGPVLVELLHAVLERDVSFCFEAPGFSMSPFIRHGDTVTVEPLRGRALRVGDVVAFLRPDAHTERLVIHRIVAEEDGALVLRGDNSPEPDGPIPRTSVVGLVTHVERRGRGVRGALGYGGRWIAWFNARGWLRPLKTAVRAPLRVGGMLLRQLQCMPAFRAWIKRFRPAYTIREASAVDMIVVRAWVNLRESPLCQCSPDVTNYVARRGDDVLGFVQLVRRPEEQAPYNGYWLYSLIVRTRYRGLGLGEALSRHVIEQAQAEGALELSLDVFADNAPAIALYRKLGFEYVRDPALQAQSVAAARQKQRQIISMRKALG